MTTSSSPLKRLACLLLLFGSIQTLSAQWHVYCFPDTFAVPSGTATILDVLGNDDLNPPTSSINYIGNIVTCDYPFPYGASLSQNGGTLVILNNDSIQYTPPAGFTGTDHIYYGVADANNPTYAVDTARVLISVGTVTGLSPQISSQIELWPNPTQDVLRIRTSESVASVQVFGMDGRRILSGTDELDVSGLAKGVYIARISIAGGFVHRRFVKE